MVQFYPILFSVVSQTPKRKTAKDKIKQHTRKCILHTVAYYFTDYSLFKIIRP